MWPRTRDKENEGTELLGQDETYQVIGKIGEGAGGEVYRAYHTRLQKDVVLKRIKNENMGNIRREADALKDLKHQYLPQVLDFIEDGKDIYTVMDFIEGQPLSKVMEVNGWMDLETCLKWMEQLCEAVGYLHRQNPPVLHGDIKPANIMIKKNGDICLIDFNTAITLKGIRGVQGYTKRFASPEQIQAYRDMQAGRRPRAIDLRADIFSMGATMCFLLTGKSRLSDEWMEEPEEDRRLLLRIVEKAMNPDPSKRYQSVETLLADIRRVKYGRVSTERSAFDKRKKRGKGWKILLVVVILLIASIAVGIRAFLTVAENRCEEAHEKTVTLFEEGKYDQTITYAYDNMVKKPFFWRNKDQTGEMYYLLGNSCLQEERYEEACDYLKEALDCKKNSQYYRDYAVSLIYCDKLDEAKEQLETAKRQGMTERDIYYTEGEILEAEGSYDKAKANYQQSMIDNEDEYMVMRAYLATADCIEKADSTGTYYQSEIQLLEKGKEAVSTGYQDPILERLAQTYIEYGDKTGSSTYYNNAITTLYDIINIGRDQFETHDSLVVIYTKTGQYQLAETELQNMKNTYGENYIIYKRYAFLEIEEQEKKTNEKRDYSNFKKDYKKANSLYSSTNQPEEDMEMKNLDDVYNQLEKGGW